MAKVILNKSTKLKGKGLILAGVEVEVTADEKKQLEKGGFLGEVKKSNKPTNEKEINELVAKVAELEEAASKGGKKELTDKVKELEEQVTTLTSEKETLESEKVTLEEQVTTLTGKVEELTK